MINSFAAISVMFLWALCYPLLVVGLDYSSPLLFATIRALLSGLFLVVLARILKRESVRGVSNWRSIMLVGLSATTLGFWGMFHAARLVSPGLATIITNVQPLIAVLLGWYFLAERPSLTSISGIVLGFFGILLISADSVVGGDNLLLKGITYILLAAGGIAISNVILKKMASSVDIFYAMGWQLIIGAFPLGAMSFFLEYPQQLEFRQEFVFSVLVVSLFGTSLAFVLWFWLLERIPLYKANTYTFLTPVLGLAMSTILYAESLNTIQLSGIFSIILGIYLANYNHDYYPSNNSST